MKLYDVPRNSYIRVVDTDIRIPPEAGAISKSEKLNFKSIDGMYSYCINKAGEVVHLAAWTEVEVITKEQFNEG